MAEENARPGRGRKKESATDTDSSSSKKKKATTAKDVTKKTAKPATTRTRRPKLVADPTREAIAEHAYQLWERGEPGGETEHWLRAEAEIRVA